MSQCKPKPLDMRFSLRLLARQKKFFYSTKQDSVKSVREEEESAKKFLLRDAARWTGKKDLLC